MLFVFSLFQILYIEMEPIFRIRTYTEDDKFRRLVNKIQGNARLIKRFDSNASLLMIFLYENSF